MPARCGLNVTTMPPVCNACNAFIGNYRLAAELRIQVVEKMLQMVSDDDFHGPEFQRLRKDSAVARSEYAMAKVALRVHMESHARRLLN